jgi:hypothetical protein
MKRVEISTSPPSGATRARVTPLERFQTMLDHDSFAVLAPAPLFKHWVQNTEWLLTRQEQCTSAVAASAMFELHQAQNADIEQFIEQINLLLEEGREHPDLAVVARAMIVGLAITLHWSFTLEAVENALARH